MAAKRTNWTAFISPGWTVAVTVVTFIVTMTTFYVTTSGTLTQHSSAINDLTKVLKEESQARTVLEKNEAAQREKLRTEYLSHIKEQTTTFTTLSEKIGGLGTEVKVMGTRYDSINDRLKQVIEQTAPHTGAPRRR